MEDGTAAKSCKKRTHLCSMQLCLIGPSKATVLHWRAGDDAQCFTKAVHLNMALINQFAIMGGASGLLCPITRIPEWLGIVLNPSD